MNFTLGSDSAFDALVYSESHPNTLNYLKNQFNHYSDTLTSAARDFMQRGQAIFETFNGNGAVRFARDVIKQVCGDTQVKTDTVKSLFELEHIQQAGLVMQRWIMANPVVRNAYNAQQVDGFHGSYFDVEPGAVGETHYDYRRVMDGVMQISENDWKIVHYMDELKEGDRELLIEEKSDVLSTWMAIEALMELGRDDPTSSVGGSL